MAPAVGGVEGAEPVTDVLGNGPVEQLGLLGHVADPAPQRSHRDVPDILAVDPDRPVSHAHEPQQQFGQCRLARTQRTDEGHVLAWRHRQRQVVEERAGRPVAEVDAVDIEPTVAHDHCRGVGRVADVRHLGGDGRVLGGAAKRPREGPQVLERLLEAHSELGRVVEDQVQRGGRGPVVDGHGRPRDEGQQGAHHDGRLKLQLRPGEDRPGPQVGLDRLAHEALDPHPLLGLGRRHPHGHEVVDGVRDHPRWPWSDSPRTPRWPPARAGAGGT